MGPQVEAHVRRRGSVGLKVVNVGNWDSPAARDLGITSLPQLWLYVDGKLVTKSTQRVVDLID